MSPHHRLLPHLCGLDNPIQSYHVSQVQSSSATSGRIFTVVAGLLLGGRPQVFPMFTAENAGLLTDRKKGAIILVYEQSYR